MIIFILSAIATYFLWKKIIIPLCKSDKNTTEKDIKENHVFYYGYEYDPEFDEA